MNGETPDNRQLLIIPCDCLNYTGRLVQTASRILAEHHQLRLADAAIPEGLQCIRRSIAEGNPVIAVDGCLDCCMKRELDGHRLNVEFYLNLVDLAIEERATDMLDPADLELVQDAIIASATRTKDPFPRFTCCCCG